MNERCDCSLPLHYTDPVMQAAVQALVDQFGEFTSVQVAGSVAYWVPRHYLALHGLKAWELRELAGRYGWRCVDT